MDPSLQRRRYVDHPTALIALLLVVIGAISGYVTLRLVQRDTTDACTQSLGRVRIHMSANQPPHALDANGWDAILDLYEGVNVDCAPDVAETFRTGEFAVWSEPALQGLSGEAATTDTFEAFTPDSTPDSVDVPTDVPADDVTNSGD